MKKHLQKIILVLLLFTRASEVFAYRYTFSNHTAHQFLVGIKLCCVFENMVSKVVKPNRMITFVHGEDFPNIKFGYCLQSISYVKNPTLKNKTKPQTAPWKEINTTWIKTENYDTILEFAESVGATTEATGKAIAKAVVAAQTGGASIGAEATTKSAKTAIEPDTVTPETKTSSSFGLGKFSKGIAKLVSITTCRDRHWDIYEDEDGTIRFESKVQQ